MVAHCTVAGGLPFILATAAVGQKVSTIALAETFIIWISFKVDVRDAASDKSPA